MLSEAVSGTLLVSITSLNKSMSKVYGFRYASVITTRSASIDQNTNPRDSKHRSVLIFAGINVHGDLLP